MDASPPLSLDNESTWPLALLELLNENLVTLASFEAERARIDSLAQSDPAIRLNAPFNPYADLRRGVLDYIAALIVNERLVGWHCTRLHEVEIASIQRDGLSPLSPDLITQRIHARVAAADISPEMATRLLMDNHAANANRQGMIWLIFTKSPLFQESGVIRLLQSWGGEALYLGQEDDHEIGPALRQIGKPCIVEAVVAVQNIETFCGVNERILTSYLYRRAINTGHGPDMEGFVRKSIPANDVLRIIEREDPDFEIFTNCATWRRKV